MLDFVLGFLKLICGIILGFVVLILIVGVIVGALVLCAYISYIFGTGYGFLCAVGAIFILYVISYLFRN